MTTQQRVPAGPVRRLVDRGARAWQERGGSVTTRTGRLTAAAVVAYLIAHALFPTTQPLTGPLTALLVVQATLYSTVTSGFRRLFSVLAGVLVAVLLSTVLGLTWWSLGVAIAASLVIGQLLRLGEHQLEVPISAMLVLGVASAESAAASRVAETLVGAGVGVLVNILLPPRLKVESTGAAVEEVAVRAAAVLSRAARELPHRPSREQAVDWLQEVRGLAREVERADRAITEFSQGRRLNPRSVGSPDPEPVLRSGLDALEHSTVALRALFRSIVEGVGDADGVGAAEGPGEDTAGYSAELLGAVGVLLAELGSGILAFGALVRSDAESGGGATDFALGEALDALQETQAVLTELLMIDAGEDPDLWMLSGSLLAAVGRVLRELDVQEWTRQRERRAEATGSRGRALRAIDRLRSTRTPSLRPRRRGRPE